MFKHLDVAPSEQISVHIDGTEVKVTPGETVAAALLSQQTETFRTTPISGANRAPYCMMGVCFECLVEIDGLAGQQACLTTVQPGMKICRQLNS